MKKNVCVNDLVVNLIVKNVDFALDFGKKNLFQSC